MKVETEIPSSITLVRVDPSAIEVNGRVVDVDRHSLRIQLPSGHSIEAQISRMDFYKVQEILGTYRKPSKAPKPVVVVQAKCPKCKQTLEEDSESCPACGYERS